MRTNHNMLKRELRELVRLAVPLSVVQVGYQLAGLVDTLFAGRLDDASLGAVGVGSSVFFASSVIGVGVSLGLDPLASQAFGAGERERSRHLLWQGIYTALLLSIPLCGLVVLTAYLMPVMGVVPELASLCRDYMIARLPSLPLLLVSVTMRSYLQAAHVTRPIVWATIWTNAFNVVANYLFIYGDQGLTDLGLPALGLPTFGVEGLGYATVLSVAAQVITLALAVRSLIREDIEARPVPRPQLASIATQLRIGLPIGLHLVAEVGVFSAAQVLMGSIGVTASAAHQTAIMIASLSFSACIGIGSATSVQVGRAIGRGDSASTRRLGLLGVGLGGALMTLSAMVMWTVPQHLARLITPEPEVITAAVVLLRIAGAFQIVDGVQAVLGGALRGAGITKFTFLAHLVAHWVIGLPLGVLLAFVVRMGPAGIWWGLTGGLTMVAGALAWRYLQLTAKPVQPLAP